MLSIFRRLLRGAQGTMVVEYTLVTSLIALATIVSIRSVSSKVSNLLGAAANSLN